MLTFYWGRRKIYILHIIVICLLPALLLSLTSCLSNLLPASPALFLPLKSVFYSDSLTLLPSLFICAEEISSLSSRVNPSGTHFTPTHERGCLLCPWIMSFTGKHTETEWGTHQESHTKCTLIQRGETTDEWQWWWICNVFFVWL